MSKILLATDLSVNALNAALYAMELYGCQGNAFKLLHGYQYPLPRQGFTFSVDDVARASEEGLRTFQASLEAKLPGQPWQLSGECREGGLDVLLRSCAQEVDPPDLVVMGARNTEGFPHFVMGSMTAAVIKRSGLPVLAVPEDACYQGMANILVTDDGQAIEEPDMAVLSNMIQRTGARVHVLRMVTEEVPVHVGPAGPGPLERAIGAAPHSYLHKSGDDLVQAVDEAMEEVRADLVVAVHHERSFLERLFHRSSSARLAVYAKIPLLVLQQRDRRA